MFFKPRFVLRQLILIVSVGLTACASLFGTPSTPTPSIPTSTPEPPTATPPPSVAIVNGEYITFAELDAELAGYKAAQTVFGIKVEDKDVSKKVFEDMVEKVLFAKAVREGGS